MSAVQKNPDNAALKATNVSLVRAVFAAWFWVELPGKIAYAMKSAAWTTNCWHWHGGKK